MNKNKISQAGEPAGDPLTVKNVLRAAVPIVLLQLFLAGAIYAQQAASVPPAPAPSSDTAIPPSAVTISVRGKCDYSQDGVTFSNLDRGQLFEQGAIVRTGEDSRADLFFRRTGVTVRLQPGTEIRLEKMTVTMKDDRPAVHTLLDLRTGRIFTVVRSEVAGSILEIRNAAGRSVVEGSGTGKYIITADGTHVAGKNSVIPLKVQGETGVTIVAPGEQFGKKEGKSLPVSASDWTKELIELDELAATVETAASEHPSPKP